MALADEAKKLMGNPWQLFSVGNLIMVGLMSILFMLILQVAGMGLHRMTLWRATGSAHASPVPFNTSAALAATTTESN